MRRLALVLALAVAAGGIWLVAAWHSPQPTKPKPLNLDSTWPVLGQHKPVLGVDLYALNNYSPAVVERDGTRTLAYIKNVLKANAVGLVWNFFAPSDHSDDVESTNATLSPSNVAILTSIAAHDGLLVEYRPVILVPTQHNPWSGKIAPPDPSHWFASYFQAELPYLRTAQRLHVSEFVTATEMHLINGSPLWSAFFGRVSKVYHGVVSYAAWDYDYFPPYGHDVPVKYFGMDMYWRMASLSATSTSQQVSDAWQVPFIGVPSAVLHRTAIDETGIAASANAYANPAHLGFRGRQNPQVQANWFIAACETVQHFHMRGVFFWKVDLTDNPAHPATSLSTFEGRIGATAIGDCAQILR